MSTIKVDTIQSRQHSTSTINLTSTGATVNGDCTATTFSGSGANLTSIPAANLTGTLPALSAANLTSIPAANLTGTLPAIDGSNLTGISSSETHPAWFGRQASTQHSMSTATWITITNLTDESVNPSSNSSSWNSSTGIFVVDSGQAGIYYAFGGCAIDDIQGGDVVRVGISKNNGTPAVYGESKSYTSNQIFQAQMSQVFTLAVGDTLRFKVYHDEGTSEATEHTHTYFGGFRIFAT